MNPVIAELIDVIAEGKPDSEEGVRQLALLLERSSQQGLGPEYYENRVLPKLCGVVLNQEEQAELLQAVVSFSTHHAAVQSLPDLGTWKGASRSGYRTLIEDHRVRGWRV